MDQKPLTGQQQKVLEFVNQFLRDHGFPPTLREIGDAVNLANINAVRGHLAALEKKGYINKTPDKARSIQVVSAPTVFSRIKRKLHEVLRTNEGVFHRVVYGLAWTTCRCTSTLQPLQADKLKAILDRQAMEHGWTILDLKIEPDHVVLVVEVWPNHSAEQTVRRIQKSSTAMGHALPKNVPAKALWGKGYVATTDLDLLHDLVEKLLENERHLK